MRAAALRRAVTPFWYVGQWFYLEWTQWARYSKLYWKIRRHCHG